MKPGHVTVAALAVVSVMVGATNLVAQQRPAPSPKTAKAAPKGTMPAPIKAAFEKSYPNATVKSVSKEKEDGVTVYEVESVDNGLTRDIVYKPDGSVVLMEEGIAEADVPQAVRQAVAARYPKGKVVKAEKTTSGSSVWYEIQVTAAGKTHAVELDADGKPHKAKED